jgi:hypothetical protein
MKASTMLVVIGAVIAAAITALIISSMPEIRRYLKMRAM